MNQNTYYALFRFMKNIILIKIIKWKLLINSGQILSESKIDNSTIEVNDLTVMKLPKLNDNQSIPKWVPCGKSLLNSMRGLKIRISKSHYDVYKKQITDKYVLTDSNDKDDSMKENNQ